MRRVLLVGWGAVGDTIHAIPAINVLRRGLAAGDEIWFASFLARREGVTRHGTLASDLLVPLGLVDRVRHRVVPAGRLGIAAIEMAVLASVLSRKFDRIFVMMPFAARPKLLGLLSRWCSSVFVTGNRATGVAPSGDRPLCWHLLEMVCECQVVSADGGDSALPFIVPPGPAVQEAEEWLARCRRHPERPLVAVAPDASYPANRWPTERFVALVRSLEARGGFEVVLCGGASSAGLCAEISSACGGTLMTAGELSILGTAALFQRCAILVGLDTGTTHLASASGAPFVALYGQRGTGRWYYPPCPNGVVLERDVPCRGCWLTHCNQPGHPCLADIRVQDVLDAVSRVVAGGRDQAQANHAPPSMTATATTASDLAAPIPGPVRLRRDS